jgi:putative nucleotidyltransferase with HDIG domain
VIEDSKFKIKRSLSLLESHVGFKVDTLLKHALKARDSYTLEHSERVVSLAEQIGRDLGLDDHQMDLLSLAAGFHDIGKIGIADQILLKPGKLSSEEYQDIKQHTLIGANMLKSLGDPILDEVAHCVLHHHEQWNGKGYPDGLQGDEIPTISRIIAVVDAYDAMTTTRSYRSELEIQQAVAIIRQESGKQFCPSAVQALLELCSKSPSKSKLCY